MTNVELIDSFVRYLLVERRYSEETAKAYRQDLLKFETFLTESGESALEKVRLYDVRLFLGYLDEQKMARGTISRILSSLRGFYSHLLRERIIEENPVLGIPYKRKSLRLPKHLYEEELGQLLEAARGDGPLDYRNLALMELLYATGMRISECRNIQLDDLDFQLGIVLVTGKGNKDRYIPFGHFAQDAIQEYIQKGRLPLMEQQQKTHSYLFVNHLGDPLTTRGMEYILKQIKKKAGLTVDLHPHMLRHTFATDMLNEGADMRTVQELLGHASLSSTQIYTHVTKDALQRNYRTFHPRARRRE